MKRRRSSAFSTGILAVVMAVAGLVSTTPAQAQTLHYGPDGGRECWATPVAGGYQMDYNAPGEGIDGETHYLGKFTIVRTDGDKTYVQGSVTGGGNTYNFQPTSYFTPSEHFYYATWPHNGGQSESKTLNNPNPPPAGKPPTVSISAPAGGATYTAPATVKITASASDADGTIAKVEFYQGATKLGEDTSSSGGWSYTWNGATVGAYALKAKAYDNVGASTESAVVNISVTLPPGPNQAPAILTPASTASKPSAGMGCAVQVTATDDGKPSPPSTLTYTWSKVSGPGGVTFSPNGTAGSSSSIATFDTAGTYSIKVLVSDGKLSAKSTVGVTVTAALPGLKGTYFNNKTLTGDPVLTRTDGTVDFAWGGAPDPALPADNFSVRWTGSVLADYSGTYTFYVTGDDGVRLWVNSQQLVDQWKDQGPTEYSGTIELSAGRKYDVKLEYYESGGGAEARLKWAHASVPKAVIPQDHLVIGP